MRADEATHCPGSALAACRRTPGEKSCPRVLIWLAQRGRSPFDGRPGRGWVICCAFRPEEFRATVRNGPGICIARCGIASYGNMTHGVPIAPVALSGSDGSRKRCAGGDSRPAWFATFDGAAALPLLRVLGRLWRQETRVAQCERESELHNILWENRLCHKGSLDSHCAHCASAAAASQKPLRSEDMPARPRVVPAMMFHVKPRARLAMADPRLVSL